MATISLQLKFEEDQYGQVQVAATEENNRQGFTRRNEKIHQKDMIPILVGQGLQFRKGEIYTPADKLREFKKDEKFNKLIAKAQVAMEEFKEYQDKLLAG